MIHLFRPYMNEEEVEAIREVIYSGWIGLGPKTAEFEKQFAKFTGSSHVVGVNSCTAALDLALKLLNIRNGDEVIVPAMTFVSSAHAVSYNLAYPVFCDIDSDTCCIDPEDISKKITVRTKAVIVVHYGGHPANMDAIREATGPGIALIEDAAHACGSSYKGKMCGSIGNIGCFSFQAVKNLAMGDGGALVLNDKEMAERAKRLRWLGIDKGTWDRTKIDKTYWWEYFVDEIGLKCHMNDIMAAIGLVQLKKLPAMNARRQEIANQYTSAFSLHEWIQPPPKTEPDCHSSNHLYCIKLRAGDRDKLSVWLEQNGISTGVHYKPIHLYSCYGNRCVLPNAENTFKNILSLPMHPGLSDSDISFIIDTVIAFGKKYALQ